MHEVMKLTFHDSGLFGINVQCYTCSLGVCKVVIICVIIYMYLFFQYIMSSFTIFRLISHKRINYNFIFYRSLYCYYHNQYSLQLASRGYLEIIHLTVLVHHFRNNVIHSGWKHFQSNSILK